MGVVCVGRKSPKIDELERIVFSAIQNWIQVFDTSLKKRDAAIKSRNRKNINEKEESIPVIRDKMKDIKRKKLREYEAYYEEKTSRETFLEKKKLFDEEIRLLEDKIRELEAVERDRMDEDVIYSELEAVCNAFRESNLTNEMARAFIDKVLVYDEERIEIVCRFQDQLIGLE